MTVSRALECELSIELRYARVRVVQSANTHLAQCVHVLIGVAVGIKLLDGISVIHRTGHHLPRQEVVDAKILLHVHGRKKRGKDVQFKRDYFR